MLRLVYDSLVIAVSAPRAPLAWLSEFLSGPFAPAPPGAPPASALALALDASPPGAGGPEIDAFTRDGGFKRLRSRRDPDGSLVLLDAAVRYVLRGTEVTVLAESDGPPARLGLLRAAREIATTHALRLGRLHLHAAAADLHGHVVAIAGPRRSGKTTLLLHALLAGGARYVTNDRLFVGEVARGMPTIVTLRDETLVRFPEFATQVRASGYSRHLSIAEAKAGTAGGPSLSPAQLCALAGAEPVPAGRLGAVLFPRLAPGVARFELRPLPPRDAAARLRTSLFLAGVPERTAAAFDPTGWSRDGAALDRRCAELAATVPCADVLLGAGAYEGKPTIWDAIAERLA
jgi:hypothetical protein